MRCRYASENMAVGQDSSPMKTEKLNRPTHRVTPFLRLKDWLVIRALVYFELVGKIQNVETIAVDCSIRDLRRLRKRYGSARWRKLKGWVTVQLADGTTHRAE